MRRGRGSHYSNSRGSQHGYYEHHSHHNPVARFRKILDERNTRILIREKNVKVVLGPGGSYIKDIKSKVKDNTRICIFTTNPNGDPFLDNAPDRVVNVDCDPDDLPQILTDLIPHIQYAAPDKMQQKPKEIRVLVPDYVCSTIIGPKGANVQGVQNELGSHVQIYRDTLPNCNENVVSISNKDISSLVDSVIRIFDSIKNIKSISHVSLYNPQLWSPGEHGETGSYVDCMDYQPSSSNRGRSGMKPDRYYSNRHYPRSNGYVPEHHSKRGSGNMYGHQEVRMPRRPYTNSRGRGAFTNNYH